MVNSVRFNNSSQSPTYVSKRKSMMIIQCFNNQSIFAQVYIPITVRFLYCKILVSIQKSTNFPRKSKVYFFLVLFPRTRYLVNKFHVTINLKTTYFVLCARTFSSGILLRTRSRHTPISTGSRLV